MSENGLDLLDTHRAVLTLWASWLLPPWLRGVREPEDFVQDALQEVCRRPEVLASRSCEEVRAYLRVVLKHNILDAARRGGVNAPNLVSLDRSSAQLEQWLAADHSSPSDRAAREERLERLAHALASLPQAQRAAVEMKHLQGLSVATIARILGRTETAIGGLLRRGIDTLREILDEAE